MRNAAFGKSGTGISPVVIARAARPETRVGCPCHETSPYFSKVANGLLPTALFFAILLTSSLSSVRADNLRLPPTMQRYAWNGAYILYTDLPLEQARDVYVHMNAMAMEYRRRLSGLAPNLNLKLPFYLFQNREDYAAAGAPAGSAGVFMADEHGQRLMAFSGPELNERTWHIIQHEGFHQYFFAAIGGALPPWLNEGMAEYFGEGRYTGDNFVTGLVPPDRLKRIREDIDQDQFLPFYQFRTMSYAEWNSKLTHLNYDQGWSMVHFLAHADGEKYQPALSALFNAVHRRASPDRAWTHIFGTNDRAVEKKWKDYWLGLPDDPTHDLYAKATAETLTSFFARASAHHQAFATVDEFLDAAKGDQLKLPTLADKDWLPSTLLHSVLPEADGAGTWELSHPKSGPPHLICTLADGLIYTGSWTTSGQAVEKVIIDEKPTAKPKTAATQHSPKHPGN